jgi:hypothetical protein
MAATLSATFASIDDDVEAPKIDLANVLRDAGTLPPEWTLDAACEALETPFAMREVKHARVTVANTGPDAFATPFALGLVGLGSSEDRVEALGVLRTAIRAPGLRSMKARLILFLNAKAKLDMFVATFPSPVEYRNALLEFYVPIFNAAHASERRCLGCGQEFALRTSREVESSHYCSDECIDRAAKRGARGGKHYTAGERRQAQSRRHMASCAMCGTGKLCSKGERLLSAVDALDRKRGKMPAE